MKVLIVGGGIGGLALAAFLRDSSVDYEVIEKSTDWSKQGLLIALWDSARDIMRKLGLERGVDARGNRVRKYSLRDGSGAVLREYDLSYFIPKYGSAMTIISRPDMHELLLSRVDTSRVRMGVALKELSQDAHKVQVKFSDGTEGEYDVVVGADGVHSSVRGALFGEHMESYENWRIWLALIDNSFNQKASLVEYIEPRELAVIGSGRGKTMITLFAPADHALWDLPEGRRERLKEIFKDERAIMPRVLEGVRDEDIIVGDLITLKLRKWFLGKVVLLGDAAHSFGPHAGIGGGMALEDAYVLAAALMRVSPVYPLERALAQYEAARKKRLHHAEHVSFRMREFTLVKSRVWRRAVNALARFMPASFVTDDLEALLSQEI